MQPTSAIHAGLPDRLPRAARATAPITAPVTTVRLCAAAQATRGFLAAAPAMLEANP